MVLIDFARISTVGQERSSLTDKEESEIQRGGDRIRVTRWPSQNQKPDHLRSCSELLPLLGFWTRGTENRLHGLRGLYSPRQKFTHVFLSEEFGETHRVVYEKLRVVPCMTPSNASLRSLDSSVLPLPLFKLNFSLEARFILFCLFR